jgi:hypothetical protein
MVMTHAQPKVGEFGIIGDPRISPLAAHVDASLRAAIAKTDLDPDTGIYSINGMSGKKYRYFINTLVGAVPNARYLEVGSWMGSTLCSAIHGNTVRAVAIDNWSEFFGPKNEFIANVNRFTTPGAEITFIEGDFRSIDYAQLPGPFNVYLFDGPHEAIDQYQGLSLPLPCLADQFVFIVDDWNWQRVRDGTMSAISQCGFPILYAAAVRTTDDNNSPPHLTPLEDFRAARDFDWHNGYFIAVLSKPAILPQL